MFVKASNKAGGVHFTVVDCIRSGEAQELEQILDLGVVSNASLEREQAWFVIAENLITSDLDEQAKGRIVKDLAQWLSPLSVASLNQTRADDLRQLEALSDKNSTSALCLPSVLSEKDPLMMIARWLEAD